MGELEPLGHSAGSDPFALVEALEQELRRLSGLTEREFNEKLAHIKADIVGLGEEAARAAEQAERAAQLHEQAQKIGRSLEGFARFAEERAEERHRPRRPRANRAKGRGRVPVEQADSTRNRVLQVMAQDPYRHWTPQLVHDELRRVGHPRTRSNVQTTLQRLAASREKVERVSAGTYELIEKPVEESGEPAVHRRHYDPDVRHEAALKAARTKREKAEAEKLKAETSVANGPSLVLVTNDTQAPPRWLAPEILDRVATEAVARFIAQHPDAADPDALVEEAKRRVVGWTQRQQQEPYDEAHVRRLIKTALNDYRLRTQRSGAEPG